MTTKKIETLMLILHLMAVVCLSIAFTTSLFDSDFSHLNDWVWPSSLLGAIMSEISQILKLASHNNGAD